MRRSTTSAANSTPRAIMTSSSVKPRCAVRLLILQLLALGVGLDELLGARPLARPQLHAAGERVHHDRVGRALVVVDLDDGALGAPQREEVDRRLAVGGGVVEVSDVDLADADAEL